MDVVDFFRVVRTHWFVILVCVILGSAIGFTVTVFQPRVYQADATGTVVAASDAADPNSAMLYDNLAKSKVKSYIQWAKTRTVAQSAIEELGISTTPEQLVKRIEVLNPEDTPVIKVTAEAGTPKAARDLATAWLNGLSKEGTEQTSSQSDTQLLTLRVTESAALPSQPVSPNVRLSIAAGGIIGLLVGLAYSILKSILDQRLRSAEQIEEQFELSVIGSIPVNPDFNGEQRIGQLDDDPRYNSAATHNPAAESLRALRTNLQFVNVDDPPRKLVVSSPLPGDGKSTVTASLALMIAASGQRVVLIDADLRRPTVARTFGLIEGVGLTDVLVGNAELSDVLQPWGKTGNFFVIGAGQHPPNPSELLASRAMKTILDELSQHAMVLLDAPPLIPVTDAAILANRADGILVVASAGKTTTDAMSKAIRNLERVHVKPLGVILNKVPARGPHSNGYDTYYAEYYGDPERKDPNGPSDDARSTRASSSRRRARAGA